MKEPRKRDKKKSKGARERSAVDGLRTGPGLSPEPTSTTKFGGHACSFQGITAEDLQKKNFPPIEFIVPGLLAPGLTILCGAPKVGKSWMALDLASSIATGGKFLESIPVPQHDVLALCLEDSQRRLQQRLDALGLRSPWPPGLTFATERSPGDIVGQIASHLDSRSDTKLVVIDTLAKVRPSARPGQGAYQEDYFFAGRLQGLAIERDVAIVAVHHDRKQGANDFIDSVSGTHGLTGAADCVLLLTRERASKDALLMMTGRDIESEDPWQLRRQGARWSMAGTVDSRTFAATNGLGEDAGKVVAFVNHAAGPVTPSQVADGLDLTAKQAADALRRLTATGRLVKPARGLYASPDHGGRAVPSDLCDLANSG